MSSIISYETKKTDRENKPTENEIQIGGNAFCILSCFIIDMDRMMYFVAVIMYQYALSARIIICNIPIIGHQFLRRAVSVESI